MSTPPQEESDATRRIEIPTEPEPAPAAPEPTPQYEPQFAEAPAVVPASPEHLAEPSTEILYVPLAVTVGDGFKFGCGFFMAFVLMLLAGFVLSAALFALTSLMGINLPVGR